MRIPVWLAWLLLALGFFTAGLLRRFHDQTPTSPFVPPIVGSLLFAAIVFLLLVAAREWRQGAVPGPGVRLGSVTPILLMLLIEKWTSLTIYNPVFYFINSNSSSNSDATPTMLDAQFRAFAGLGLLLVCMLVGGLSAPAARKTLRRAHLRRWLPAALATLAVIGGTLRVVGVITAMLGGRFRLAWPAMQPLLWWVLGGQALLAFAEEIYYRGLLLSEMERLAPRLGVRGPAGRRWTAVTATSLLFGMEHLSLEPSWGEIGRQLIFAVSLGMLFGLLVMVSANLHFAAGIHAWINWLLLGAAPVFVGELGQPALPAGVYIGLTLILAFVLAYVVQRIQLRRTTLARGRH